MKLVVFSICKDEAKTVGELLDRIPKKIKGIEQIETLIVSDGSIDDTASIARDRDATVVIEGSQQKRLAFRFEQAVEKALEMKADIVVNIDGDLQFQPEDIPKLVRPVLDHGYDFVAADRFTDTESGSRRKPHGMPGNKYWANRIGAWIVGQMSGYRFRDVTCGFRAYNRKALLALNINSPYTYTQESFQLLAAKRMNIKAIPINVKYYNGRKSRVVTSFSRFLFGSAFNILRAYRDFAPIKFFGGLGGVNIVIGLGAMGFAGVHWLNTGQFSPYKAVGILGIYFFSLGLLLVALGLVADMLDRSARNQEKILSRLKTLQFEDDDSR